VNNKILYNQKLKKQYKYFIGIILTNSNSFFIIFSMLYTLSEIQTIIQDGFEYTLPTSILQSLDRIEKEINNSSIKKMYSTPSSNTFINPNTNTSNNTTNIKNKSYIYSNSNNTSSSINKFKDRDRIDKDWENVRNFKITKIEKKEGTDKIINDIRICLNKMSNKNYDTQKTTILELLHNMIETSENNDDLQKVATAIFDIASTNKFYSEIYAKIYNDLMELYPVFHNILNDFLLQFLNTVSDLEYVDPNIDYDAYCNYNKQNDRKKATVVFIIFMMKQNAILPKNVIDILHELIIKLEVSMNIDNHLNEVEEITEIINLFILEGYVFLSKEETENNIWKTDLLKIREFSQLKMKDKLSLSSRVIFKYMDICSFIDKNK
jgi:hypothetical protein